MTDLTSRTAGPAIGSALPSHQHQLEHALRGTVNPTTAPGVAAPVGSTFGRDNAGAGELWLKTGAADTAWTRITVP